MANNFKKQIKGKIIKSVGGICTIQTSDGVFTAKPRRIFRLNDISPVVGDNVILQKDSQSDEYVVFDIEDRKNYLVRPPLANLDAIAFVISSCKPRPSTIIIDKLIAIAESKDVESILIFTKNDIKNSAEFSKIYSEIGYKVFCVNSHKYIGFDEIKQYFNGKLIALIGNSGVGKTTFLNMIMPNLNLQTQEISKKLGRGKHTTRHAEIYSEGGMCIADTPGFSTVDIERYGRISAGELQNCFLEFQPFKDKCRFSDCSHINEQDCEVKKACENGLISQSRYKSYEIMYKEALSYNSWE